VPRQLGVLYLVGKIRQVTDPTGTYGFAYDNMGRLIGTTTQYSYLGAGPALRRSWFSPASPNSGCPILRVFCEGWVADGSHHWDLPFTPLVPQTKFSPNPR
jgi:YD repeat-containing protein